MLMKKGLASPLCSDNCEGRCHFKRYSAGAGGKGAGFTLIELLIVVIIIMILAGLSVSLMFVFTKGQAVKQSANEVEHAIFRAAELSRAKGIIHFVVFSNATSGGEIMLWNDKNGDKVFDSATDEKVDGNATTLAQFVRFKTGKFPAWIGFERSGRMRFPAGWTGPMNPGTFETNVKNNAPDGDIVLVLTDADGNEKPYKMYGNIDDIAGKVRKWHFWAE